MGAYIARRVLLMIPTILGIMLVSFVIVQFAPGGPVERIIAQLQGYDTGATGRFSGGGSEVGQNCLDANGDRRRRRLVEISRRAGARLQSSSPNSKSNSASTSRPGSVFF